MPTISDVARFAGVSAATVSRVVNQDPKVHPETVSRVLEGIRATGYRPFSTRRRPAGYPAPGGNSGKNILFLIPDRNTDSVHTALAWRLTQELSRLAESRRMRLTARNLNNDGALPSGLAAGEFDGVILRDGLLPEQLAGELEKYPLVKLFRNTPFDGRFDRVEPHDRLLGRLTAEALKSKGCRLLIAMRNKRMIQPQNCRQWEEPFYQERLDGFLEAAGEAEVLECEEVGLRTALSEILSRRKPVSVGLFLPMVWEPYSAQLLAELCSCGCFPGRNGFEMACVTSQPEFFRSAGLHFLHPDINPAALANAALTMLLERIEIPDQPARQLQVMPTIREIFPPIT